MGTGYINCHSVVGCHSLSRHCFTFLLVFKMNVRFIIITCGSLGSGDGMGVRIRLHVRCTICGISIICYLVSDCRCLLDNFLIGTYICKSWNITVLPCFGSLFIRLKFYQISFYLFYCLWLGTWDSNVRLFFISTSCSKCLFSIANAIIASFRHLTCQLNLVMVSEYQLLIMQLCGFYQYYHESLPF